MKYKNPNNVKVISIQVTPAKADVKNEGADTITNHIKHIIIVECFLGISRLYLLNNRRIIQWTTLLLSAAFTIFIIYFTMTNRIVNASFIVVRDTNCIEYLILVISCILTKKASLKKFFKDLSCFDVALNISEDLNVTSPVARHWLWIFMSLLYSVSECAFLAVFYPNGVAKSSSWMYVTLFAHDTEQIFFCILLRMIMTRVFILKAYVVKKISTNDKSERKLSKVEALSNKAQLDISSLHRNYELLHKCAEQLNSVMSLPVRLFLNFWISKFVRF